MAIRGVRCLVRKIYSKYKSGKLLFTGSQFMVYPRFSIRGGKKIKIGNNFLAMNNCRIEAWEQYENDKFNPEIVIGDNVSLNEGCHISSINAVYIGDNVLLGSRVLISDNAHGKCSKEEIGIPPTKRPLYSKGSVIVEKNVWVGDGVVILAGVKIGEGSIIGANAVVTKSVPSNSIVAGVPAKVIREIN